MPFSCLPTSMRLAVALAALTLTVPPAVASVINVPSSGFNVSGFGGNDLYRGQTFTALPGLADSLMFTIWSGSESISFRALLTNWEGTHPGTVLFESDVLYAPFNWFAPVDFQVNLGGIALVPGATYAWILDAFSTYVGHPDASTPYGIPYGGGVYISLPLGGMPSGTREEHFQMNWFLPPCSDLAFRLEFAENAQPVPCPPNLLVTFWGLAALTLARARRFRVR